MNQVGEAFQVELPGGKRTRVRARDVLFQFSSHEPAELIKDANQVSEEIDLDFLWEVAGENEFDYQELGKEYFGHDPRPEEAAGLLLRLHSAPIYFYKKGKGRYKAAPEKSLQAALASLEKKRQQAIIQQQYVEELVQGRLPDDIKANAIALLCKPDKNSIEYKALTAACDELHISPERLLLNLGGLDNSKELHLARFLFENFPKGTRFPKIDVPDTALDLPEAEVRAF